jgi:hypothetical protein
MTGIDKLFIGRLAGIAAGIHFGRRFGLLGKTVSAYAGLLAGHYLAESSGAKNTTPTGQPQGDAGSAADS